MTERTPGITLTTERVLSANGTLVLDDRPPKDLWAELVDDTFMDAMHGAIERAVGDARPGQRGHILEELGVTAMDGLYASIMANLLRSPERGADRPENRYAQYQVQSDYDFEGDARETTRAFLRGHDTPSYLKAPYADFAAGPLAVFKAAGDIPLLEIRLDAEAFRERRADQRRRACELLTHLATVADVRLVGSRIDHRFLAEFHRGDLPSSVHEQCRTTHTQQHHWGGELERAWATIDVDGPEVWVLRQLAAASTETLTYDALDAAYPATRKTLRGYIATNRRLGLLATFGPTKHKRCELTLAGRAFLAEIDAELGRQETLTESAERIETLRFDSRVSPPTPLEDAHRVYSYTTVAEMPRWRRDALVSAAVDDGVTVCDAIQPEKANRNEPEVSYDPANREVAVGAEWDNPYAYTIRTALALSHTTVFLEILTDRALDRLLEKYGLAVLQHATCAGWLKDVTDGASFREALETGREAVLNASKEVAATRRDRDAGEASNAEFAAVRGEAARQAHGLAAEMAHLLALSDVRIVREVRLPGRATKRLAANDRRSLAVNLWNLTAKQSLYGVFSAFRHLYEQDEEKRTSAMSPEVDAADPFGGLTGAFVVTGHRASEFTDLFERTFSDAEPHEDAPDFAISIPLHEGFSRSQAALVTKRLCERKNRRATREAVSVLHGFCGSPYGIARALRHLDVAPTERELTLADVRVCLGRLDGGFEGGYDLLPEATATERDVVRVLLTTDTGFSVSDLAAEADRSLPAVRGALERLAALDMVTESRVGWRIRLTVPVLDGTTTSVSPWYVTETAAEAPTLETVLHGVWTRLPPDAGGADAGPPAWFGRWVAVLRRFVGSASRSRAVLFGDPPAQQPLPGVEVPG